VGDSRRERSDERSSRGTENDNPTAYQSRSISLPRPHAQPLSGSSRFEKSLKISICPLTKRALLPHDSLSFESFAKIGNDSPPLLFGELSIELDSLRDAKWKTEKPARWLLSRFESLRRLLDHLRRDPNFATDRLKLRERHSAT